MIISPNKILKSRNTIMSKNLKSFISEATGYVDKGYMIDSSKTYIERQFGRLNTLYHTKVPVEAIEEYLAMFGYTPEWQDEDFTAKEGTVEAELQELATGDTVYNHIIKLSWSSPVGLAPQNGTNDSKREVSVDVKLVSVDSLAKSPEATDTDPDPVVDPA